MKKILLSILVMTAICASAFTSCIEAKANTIQDEQYYLKKGQDYEWKNNRLGAAELYSQALKINPDFNEARIARAKIYYFYEQYDKALEDFEYFYNNPKYGAGTYYEYRIDCKKKLKKYSEALDDMYEVILVYGGQAKVLKEMFELADKHPELKDRLEPETHKDLIEKYKYQAKIIRDYAQTFADDKYNMKNPEYYNFFIKTADAMDASNTNNEQTQSIRKAPSDAEVIEIE